MILVVDDHQDTCTALACFMECEGYEVETANDGVEALRTLETQVPEAIVLDNHMPGLSGEGVLRAVKNAEHLKNVPVVFFTADPSPELHKRALALGAEKFVEKDGDWDHLIQEVKNLVRHKH